MKSSLWVVVVVVAAIVGFLTGYSVSSSTGTRAIAGGQPKEESSHPVAAEHSPAAVGGYGANTPASPATGYGDVAKAEKPATPSTTGDGSGAAPARPKTAPVRRAPQKPASPIAGY